MQAFRNWRPKRRLRTKISELLGNRGLGSFGEKLDEIVAGSGSFAQARPTKQGSRGQTSPLKRRNITPRRSHLRRNSTRRRAPSTNYRFLKSGGADVAVLSVLVVLDRQVRDSPAIGLDRPCDFKDCLGPGRTRKRRSGIDFDRGRLDRPGALLGRHRTSVD